MFFFNVGKSLESISQWFWRILMMQLKLQNEYFISFPISTNIFFRQFCRKLSETLGVSSLLLFCQQSQILSHVTFSLMSSLSPPATLLQKPPQNFQLTFVAPPPWHCKKYKKLSHIPVSLHCNENSIYVLPEKELCPNFQIHLSAWSIYKFPGSVHIFSCTE